MNKKRSCKKCGGTITQSTDDSYLCENCEIWINRRKSNKFDFNKYFDEISNIN